MKIAVVIDTWFPAIGGGQINAWEISKRLAKKGVQIDIITRNCRKDNLTPVQNLKVYKLGKKTDAGNFLSKIIFIFKSFFFIAGKNYDLVHGHAFLPGITARLIMVFKGIPVLFTVHGFSFNTNLNNVFSRQIEKFILTRILYSAQITVSQDFLSVKNVNNKVFYVSNGVDVKNFDKIKATKFKNPTLIFVGRLHPQKNLKNLIRAIVLVKESISDVKFLIVGEGFQKGELMNLVQKLHLKNNVKFLGQKTGKDLIRVYKSSHAFILPSIYEGQPLSLLESWASKLTPIVSNTGDCRYLVKNGVNGFVLKNIDPKGIATGVLVAFKKKNLEKLGLAGYTVVKNELSWERSAEKTLKLYKSLT